MRQTTFDPRTHDVFSQIPQSGDATEILKSSGDELEFVTRLYFRDEQQAHNWAKCINKCIRYHMDTWKEYFILDAKSMTSIQGHRTKEFIQAMTRVVVPEYITGEKIGRNGGKPEKSEERRNA